VDWTPGRKTTLKKLKDELANATLACPDLSVQFSVQTDASYYWFYHWNYSATMARSRLMTIKFFLQKAYSSTM